MLSFSDDSFWKAALLCLLGPDRDWNTAGIPYDYENWHHELSEIQSIEP